MAEAQLQAATNDGIRPQRVAHVPVGVCPIGKEVAMALAEHIAGEVGYGLRSGLVGFEEDEIVAPQLPEERRDGQLRKLFAQARLAADELLVGEHLIGDVDAVRDDGVIPVRRLQPLVHEIEVARLERSAGRAGELYGQLSPDEWLAGRAHPVEQADEPLIGRLRQGVGQALADHGTMSDKLLVGEVDAFEHMGRAPQRREEGRRLFEDGREMRPFALERGDEALALLGLRLLTGDVDVDDDAAGDASVGVENRGGGVEHKAA
jgi:hypothetical protein